MSLVSGQVGAADAELFIQNLNLRLFDYFHYNIHDRRVPFHLFAAINLISDASNLPRKRCGLLSVMPRVLQ